MFSYSQTKNYLYIPFLESENNEELYEMAKRWQKNILKGGEYFKAPEIVVHRDLMEINASSKLLQNASHRFDIDIIPPDSSIYILAHGVGDSFYVVSNRGSENCFHLSMAQIAERIKADGLTPQLATKLKSLNLYVCEKKGANENLAINLTVALGADYSDMNISYYEAKVHLPMEPTFFYDVTPKYGIKENVLNNANKFKKTINVGETLPFENNFRNLFSR